MEQIRKIWEFIKSNNFMAVIALLGIGFAIYQTYFYEKSKALTISQGAFTKVFDVYQPVGGLEISYAGENLRDSKKVLWAVNFTIQNSGETGIKIGDFDDKAPMGIAVQGGDIVDEPKYLASNDYIQKALDLKITKEKITLSPLILEPKDYINFSMLILGPVDIQPKLISLGVIAGIGQIAKVTTISPVGKKSIWRNSVEADSYWVHLTRYLMYAFGGSMILVSIIKLIEFIIESISNIFSRKTRKNKLSTFKQNEDISKEARWLINTYQEYGYESLRTVWKLIEDIKRYRVYSEKLSTISDDKYTEDLLIQMRSRGKGRLVKDLESKNIITYEGEIGSYTPELEAALKELMVFLEINSFGYRGNYEPEYYSYTEEV